MVSTHADTQTPASDPAGAATPFGLLLDLDRRSRQRAVGLPIDTEPPEEWVGVAFVVGGHALLASMTEVAEVVTRPAVACVPGVKPWVLGIANMRGILLPILDLQGFVLGASSKADAQTQRVLVIHQCGVSAGLLVDAVLGAKHFWIDERAEQPAVTDARLEPYIDCAYERDAEHHAVFNFSRLAASEAFLDVAL